MNTDLCGGEPSLNIEVIHCTGCWLLAGKTACSGSEDVSDCKCHLNSRSWKGCEVFSMMLNSLCSIIFFKANSTVEDRVSLPDHFVKFGVTGCKCHC